MKSLITFFAFTFTIIGLGMDKDPLLSQNGERHVEPTRCDARIAGIIYLAERVGADVVEDSLLLYAAQKNFLEAVQKAIRNGANINVANEDGWTSLHCAVHNGHQDMIELLLRFHADPNVRDNNQWTPLHIACELGHNEIAHRLLEAGAFLCDDDESWSPLQLAADNSNLGLVRLLIDYGANINGCDLVGNVALHCVFDKVDHDDKAQGVVDFLMGYLAEHKESKGIVALNLAVSAGKIELVKKLIALGINFNGQDAHGWTPLHHAAHKNLTEVLEYLLECGAVENISDNFSSTPFHTALQHKSKECALRLLKMPQAGIHSIDGAGYSPLQTACLWGDVDVVEALIKAGVDISKVDERGWSPLLTACQGGSAEVVEHLIRAGLDIHFFDDNATTALHVATLYMHPTIVQLLLEHGVDPNAHDVDGWTSLHIAAENGATNIALILLGQPRLCPNLKNISGWSPLDIAAENGNKELVEALLACGVEVHDCDSDGYTALHMAANNNHDSVVQILLHEGADANALTNSNRSSLACAFDNQNSAIVHTLTRAGAICYQLKKLLVMYPRDSLARYVITANICGLERVLSYYASSRFQNNPSHQEMYGDLEEAYVIAQAHNKKEMITMLNSFLQGVMDKKPLIREVLVQRIIRGDVESVKRLLAHIVYSDQLFSDLLRIAIMHGKLQVIETLIAAGGASDKVCDYLQDNSRLRLSKRIESYYRLLHTRLQFLNQVLQSVTIAHSYLSMLTPDVLMHVVRGFVQSEFEGWKQWSLVTLGMVSESETLDDSQQYFQLNSDEESEGDEQGALPASCAALLEGSAENL